MKSILAYFSQPLLRWPLLFGLFTGLVCFGYFLILVAIGKSPLYVYKLRDFGLGIHLIFIVSAIWYYRRTVGQGRLHLWEGLTVGYIVSMSGAFVTGWLIYGFVSQYPAVFTDYQADLRAFLMRDKANMVKQLGLEQFQAQLTNVGNARAADLITDEISKKFIVAVLTVLPISLMFRRQDYSILKPE